MSKKLVLSIFLLFFAVTVDLLSLTKGPGDKVDGFTVTNYDGVTYNFSDALKASDKGVIVIFWSTECPWVQPYNDRINDYVKNYTDKGFTVWVMNSNNTESVDDVSKHAKTNNYSFPMLKDVNNVVADLFGATRTPEAFVVSKENVILYHGRISDNKAAGEQTVHDLNNAVEDVAAGKEVSVKETKSFGCGIKRIEK